MKPGDDHLNPAGNHAKVAGDLLNPDGDLLDPDGDLSNPVENEVKPAGNGPKPGEKDLNANGYQVNAGSDHAKAADSLHGTSRDQGDGFSDLSRLSGDRSNRVTALIDPSANHFSVAGSLETRFELV